MNRFLRLALLSAWFAPAAMLAASFEGKVSMKLSAGTAAAQDMQYLAKGDKIRVELPMPGGVTIAAIIEPARRQAVVLMAAQKMAMVMTLPDPASGGAGEKPGDAPKMEKTAEQETILGHIAEKYIVTHQGTKTDVWLAEGLGSFVTFNPGGPMPGTAGPASAPQGWERALAGKELFPLRAVSYDKSGKPTSRMEVTAIEKKSLPESLFIVPADFQRMDMSAMMKGMAPGGLSAPPR